MLSWAQAGFVRVCSIHANHQSTPGKVAYVFYFHPLYSCDSASFSLHLHPLFCFFYCSHACREITTDSLGRGGGWNKVISQKDQWERDCRLERSSHLVNLEVGLWIGLGNGRKKNRAFLRQQPLSACGPGSGEQSSLSKVSLQKAMWLYASAWGLLAYKRHSTCLIQGQLHMPNDNPVSNIKTSLMYCFLRLICKGCHEVSVEMALFEHHYIHLFGFSASELSPSSRVRSAPSNLIVYN